MGSKWSLSAILCGLSVLVACGGCGDTGGSAPKDAVKGKVTLNGDPVTGTIHFVSVGGKETTGPIGPDGSYQVPDVPPGEVTILIKGLPGMSAPITPKTLDPSLIKTALPETKGTSKIAVPPPAKYADAQTSGLKYTVTAGVQTKDIAL